MRLSGLLTVLNRPKFVALVFVVMVLWPHLASADSVPQNLASMARSLLLGVETELKQATGDETQDTIRTRARAILRRAGVRNWSRQPVRQDGATAEPTPSHEISVDGDDERLELKWDRQANKFIMRIRANDTSVDANDGFDLQLNGNVTEQRDDEDGEAVLNVQADDRAVSVVTAEEIKAIRASILAEWRDQEGSIWKISASGDDTNDAEQARQLEQQIEEVSGQIAAMKRERVHVWRNTETDQIVMQDRLKRLDEPFDYVGKDFRDPAAKERLNVLERRLEQLQENAKPLPVDLSDPIGMKKMRAGGRNARKLNILVREQEGYSWTYDEALLSDGQITAKRTLRSMQDVGNLPEDVLRQLITSWSPPEWVELEMRIQHEPRQVSLVGRRWRLKATYGGDSHRVKSIHTPYAKDLVLKRETVTEQSAEGASPNARL